MNEFQMTIGNTMMTERVPIFVECRRCGERWKIATTPCSVDALAKIKHRCPNCEERKDIFLCKTHGDDAVRQARDGKTIDEASK
jgi:hypothetical protein